MNDKKITLALIYGGQGCESEVSQRGAKNLLPTLSEMFNCLPVFIEKDGRWILHKNQVFAINLGGRGGFFCHKSGDFYPVDCAFPLLHGNYGEDGVIQSSLDLAGIPYIGCEGRVGAICRDKAIVKSVASSLGIPVLPFILVNSSENNVIERAEQEIGYPMFIKPTDLGSSFGASEARNRKQLVEALDKALSLSNRIIIEKLLEPKRELECGYFSTESKDLFTNVGEILCDSALYDFDSKYNKNTITLPEATVQTKTNKRIKEYSHLLVKYLGVRDLCRVDFFLSGDEIYFNEINTMPGFTGGSLYSKMLASVGISATDMLRSLVLGALKRS